MSRRTAQANPYSPGLPDQVQALPRTTRTPLFTASRNGRSVLGGLVGMVGRGADPLAADSTMLDPVCRRWYTRGMRRAPLVTTFAVTCLACGAAL